jgi:hypothetical protein
MLLALGDADVTVDVYPCGHPAIQQGLIAEVAELQSSLELKVAPPLCPLAVSPIDFTHTAELIESARITTSAWLEQPVTTDQARNLALHAQHASLASAGPKG